MRKQSNRLFIIIFVLGLCACPKDQAIFSKSLPDPPRPTTEESLNQEIDNTEEKDSGEFDDGLDPHTAHVKLKHRKRHHRRKINPTIPSADQTPSRVPSDVPESKGSQG